MSEFDDFVTQDEKEEKRHQPKKSKRESEISAVDEKESQASKTEMSGMVGEPEATQDQKTEIANSNSKTWNREQFAMFFKEAEVFGYEDLMYDAKGDLKREYNVRNNKRYEIDQAFIELALERISSEDLAKRLIENRGFDL